MFIFSRRSQDRAATTGSLGEEIRVLQNPRKTNALQSSRPVAYSLLHFSPKTSNSCNFNVCKILHFPQKLSNFALLKCVKFETVEKARIKNKNNNSRQI